MDFSGLNLSGLTLFSSFPPPARLTPARLDRGSATEAMRAIGPSVRSV